LVAPGFIPGLRDNKEIGASGNVFENVPLHAPKLCMVD
jgi:hypothetical protein